MKIELHISRSWLLLEEGDKFCVKEGKNGRVEGGKEEEGESVEALQSDAVLIVSVFWPFSSFDTFDTFDQLTFHIKLT